MSAVPYSLQSRRNDRPLLIAAASHAPHYPAEAALIDPLTGEPLDTCDARGPLVDRGQPGQLRRVSGQQGDYDEAAMLEAHRITQATFGDEHDVTVAAVEALAQVRTVGRGGLTMTLWWPVVDNG